MNTLEKLTLSIGRLDKITGPVERLQKKLHDLSASTQEAFDKISTGASGMATAEKSMQALLRPALALDKAFSGLKDLGMSRAVLQQLSSAALATSVQFGISAPEIVDSALQVRASVAGLQDDELVAFTRAGTVMAKAVQTDAGTAAAYLATMHDVWADVAALMGNDAWVRQVAGQTAAAAQRFGTNADEMHAAWATLGREAKSFGIDMAEQFAVLGTLQQTMGGSEAATGYTAFLQGVDQAQQALNLTLTDSNGQLLGIVPILNKLRATFGETLSVAESDALEQAFGSTEAVEMIRSLIRDTDGLAESIAQLGKINGLEQAEKMAAGMTDPLQQMQQAMQSLRSALGVSMLSVLEPVFGILRDGFTTLTLLIRKFPILGQIIGGVILLFQGLGYVFGTLRAASGVLQMATTGLGMVVKLFAKEGYVAKAATLAWRGAVWLTHTSLKILRGGMVAFQGILWLVNAAMYANPIGLIVLGLTALVAGVAAAVYWWEDLKAAFMDTAWGKSLMALIDGLIDAMTAFLHPLDTIWEKVQEFNPFADDEEDHTQRIQTELDRPRQARVTPGGVTNHIASQVDRSQSRRRDIGQVHIHTSAPLDADHLANELAMQAG